jgi:hypothetical protein
MSIPTKLPVYFYPHDASFWVEVQPGQWISLGKDNIGDYLEVTYKLPRKERQWLVKSFLVDCIRQRSVAFAGPIAGQYAGLTEFHGRKVLVTESPVLIEPRKGVWPLWNAFLKALFEDPSTDQRLYYYGWLKTAVVALREKKRRPGQCLVVAGPKDCGKSFWQGMQTPLLGGRAAKPYQFISGDTNFNREMFGAEHLPIEDVIAATDIKSRRNFGNKIKELTANELQTIYGKYADAFNAHPQWRTTITVNDEPENLMVLPPFDASVSDKFILLKAHDGKIPADVDRDTYREAILAELPCFLYWLLNEFTIPQDLFSRRFGITHWHHPELVAAINEMSPEAQLDNLVATHILKNGVTTWSGSSEDLRLQLLEKDRDATRTLLYFNNSCGTYLGRLHDSYPTRYKYHKSKTSRVWTISVASEETAPVA